MFQARRSGEAISNAAATGLTSTRRSTQFAVGAIFGTLTLVAGTLTVTGLAGVTSKSVVQLTLVTPGGTAGTRYKIVPSAGQIVVTSVDTAGATVATDTSAFNYKIETPLYHADNSISSYAGDLKSPASTLLLVTATNAVDLPTAIALANQVRQVIVLMLVDATAHVLPDTTNAITAPVATDLATTQTLLNNCKTVFNAHCSQAGVHVNNDTTNTVATANATDQATSNALAIALKAAVNAHLSSAPTGDSIALISP